VTRGGKAETFRAGDSCAVVAGEVHAEQVGPRDWPISPGSAILQRSAAASSNSPGVNKGAKGQDEHRAGSGSHRSRFAGSSVVSVYDVGLRPWRGLHAIHRRYLETGVRNRAKRVRQGVACSMWRKRDRPRDLYRGRADDVRRVRRTGRASVRRQPGTQLLLRAPTPSMVRGSSRGSTRLRIRAELAEIRCAACVSTASA
jgi:hypothetical protein